MEYKIITKSNIETNELALKIGKELFMGALITLEGDLGAGKTTFTKGIGEALGVKRIINSPTFTIMKIYEGKLPLYHLDVYRLEGKNEELGFDEYFNGDGVCVVEWAHFIEQELPVNRLEIIIRNISETEREFNIHPIGLEYENLCKKVLE